jgi:hypothetical protein
VGSRKVEFDVLVVGEVASVLLVVRGTGGGRVVWKCIEGDILGVRGQSGGALGRDDGGDGAS